MMRILNICLLVWGVVVFAATARADEAQFKADLDALTAAPHRLAGTPEGRAAGDYLIQRLTAMGVKQVLPLEFSLPQTRVDRCEMVIDGRVVPLMPVRPNLLANPVTPAQGVTGPMLYVGQGTLKDIDAALATHRAALGDAQTLEGMIVVIDYDSYDNWETAFSLGAAAVVFLGHGDATNPMPLHAGAPANLVRLYAHADADGTVGGLDLKQPRAKATVVSHVVWESTIGRNIIAVIDGTDAAQTDMVVLGVHYDSFGNIPQLARGAREAANVAALLETAGQLVNDPPQRKVVLLFADNQARAHQGTREFYNAIQMTPAVHKQQLDMHAAEVRFNTEALAMLDSRGLEIDLRPGDTAEVQEILTFVRSMLSSESDWAGDGLQSDLQQLRMRWLVEDRNAGIKAADVPKEEDLRRTAIADDLTDQRRRWDDIRRALHRRSLQGLLAELHAASAGEDLSGRFQTMSLDHAMEVGGLPAVQAEATTFIEQVLTELQTRTTQRLQARLRELAVLEAADAQRTALRQALSSNDKLNPISVHISYNFGDASATWGPVLGDSTTSMFAVPRNNNADSSGFYVRLLSAMRETVGDRAEALGIDPQTLRDTDLGPTFAPGRHFNGGTIAGQYRIYNLALMTGYDGRLRDGHPADTLANLDWAKLRQQSVAAAGVLRALADNPNLTQPQRFTNVATTKLTTWVRGRSTGEYAGLKVTGGLSERRPASGALIAIWPGRFASKTNALATALDALHSPGFEPIVHQLVDTNGNFPIVALRQDQFNQPNTMGAMFDELGAVMAITSQGSINQRLTDAIRTDLFLAKPKVFVYRPTYNIKPDQLKVLRANADQVFREQRTLFGQVGSVNAFFIAQQVVDDRTKLFQPMGPVVLGDFTNDAPSGTGLDAQTFNDPPWLTPYSANDLWSLNEMRLRRLRARGVTSADLEMLHSRAGRALERANTAPTLAQRESGLARSAMLSHRVYKPLRSSMDDLVHSVVVLLLLAIPFAFSMERLIIGATSIYGRIAGFTVTFLVTFALLYWLHPGFAIASTPIIIFLAFAIILLSGLVTYIVLRKFQTELKAIQGQSGGAHDLEISKAGAMLAAISMGISTMRRRPTRTFLTATTVVMLTFTILCFASFTTEIGVRSVYTGPLAEGMPESVIARNLDYARIESALPDLLAGQAGEGGLLAMQWWAVKQSAATNQATHYSVTTPGDGRTEKVNAVMGIDPREMERWPDLASVIEPAAAMAGQPILGADHIYLPRIVMELLSLKPGDRVLVQGVPATVRGQIVGDTFQRLRRIDGQPVLPVDFADESNSSGEAGGGVAAADDDALASDVQRDFVYLSADQVAVASNELVRRLGGGIHIISLYPGPGVTPTDLGRTVAQTVVMPVWAAGDQGVERLILTRLTAVAGGLRLAVPLLLGGLIIFGTLLGSISDREKEIYTFSALGLSPGHVGVLFFAEATVYAFVGGLGGQLLAQFVALGATQLTKHGIIDPVSINYSSTNSLFAIGVVMATVIISAIYPAYRASKSANPGLARAWKMPKPEGDDLKLLFPFTVSAYDITGIVSFLAEHFRRHDDAGLGDFAASAVRIGRDEAGALQLSSELALAPFDLGVTQHMTLTAVPSEIPGVDEVAIHNIRLSGASGDWVRSNRVFIRGLRRQFLLWRTLGGDVIEQYRMQTLQALGDADADSMEHTQPAGGKGERADG